MPSNWSPAYLGPSATASQPYANAAGLVVGLHVFYYRHQGEDRKLVSSVNTVVRADDHQWNAVSTSARSATSDGAAGMSVRETQLLGTAVPGQPAQQRLKVWQLYWINGYWTPSDAKAKLRAAWDRMRGQGDDAAAVFLVAPDAATAPADPALSAFLKDNVAAIEAGLVAARDGAAARP